MTTPVKNKTSKSVWGLLVDGLASYGFSCILFIFFFLMTLFGTWDQGNYGLYYCQKKYFESFVFFIKLGPVPFTLPGGYLLLTLLGLNLRVAGVMKIRLKWSNVGMFIVHG